MKIIISRNLFSRIFPKKAKFCRINPIFGIFFFTKYLEKSTKILFRGIYFRGYNKIKNFAGTYFRGFLPKKPRENKFQPKLISLKVNPKHGIFRFWCCSVGYYITI